MTSETPRAARLFVVSAPSGAGKTSLIGALTEADSRLRVAVSHTTRSKRPGEVDGEHYHFVDDDAFTRMIDNGEFLEHANVFAHRYGTSRAAVDKCLEQNSDVVLEIDWQGARAVRSVYTEACSVFILPPSRVDLKHRLRDRGQDSPRVIEQRMQKAIGEMSHYDEFEFVVVNDEFAKTLALLQEIVSAARNSRPAQLPDVREFAEKLVGANE